MRDRECAAKAGDRAGDSLALPQDRSRGIIYIMAENESKAPLKIIIDTDPGVDDAWAILLAFLSPEVEVLGLTTVFGNVRTPMATFNALHLVELAGRGDVPVAEGESKTLKGAEKVRIADFVHGTDGLGNTNPTPPKGRALSTSGPQFLVDMVTRFPHQVTIVALAPLSNIAKAIELDPTFPQKIGELLILGGAFFCNGNVNPAAEANVFGDPDAADLVFTSGANIRVIGLNVTHQIILTETDLNEMQKSEGRYADYLHKVSQFYLHYHQTAYAMKAIYLHDPATLVAAFRPDLFEYKEGVVRVQVCGVTKGATLLSNTEKVWHGKTAWCDLPTVKVAVAVDAHAVAALVKERVMAA